jgi:hypothetical protein
MKYFHLYITLNPNGREVFFKANLIDPNEDDIASEALAIGAIDLDEHEYVLLAEELTEEEYKKATNT